MPHPRHRAELELLDLDVPRAPCVDTTVNPDSILDTIHLKV
jgi:hypothetical protein